MDKIYYIISDLYDSILKDGVDKYLFHIKDILYTIVLLSKNNGINKKLRIKIFEFLNLISIYDIEDETILNLMFELRIRIIQDIYFENKNKNIDENENPFNIRFNHLINKKRQKNRVC